MIKPRHLFYGSAWLLLWLCAFSLGKMQSEQSYLYVPVCKDELQTWDEVLPPTEIKEIVL